jgi:putative tricarboxylic transport membrane protein
MADWILAICTAIGAVVYLNADSKLPQLQVGDPMGPQVFPALIGIGLICSALLLMAEAWRKETWRKETWRKHGPSGAQPRPDHDRGAKEPRHHRIVLAGMVLWTALYYLAFEPIGYLVSTLVYMFVLLAWFNRGRWLVNAACALGFTLAAYAVFTRFLQVALPQGVFGA